jgi:hypothetical protein
MNTRQILLSKAQLVSVIAWVLDLRQIGLYDCIFIGEILENSLIPRLIQQYVGAVSFATELCQLGL